MLEDTSTNGVFINGADTPASVEGAYSLQDGDRLRLGDYEILVSIDERNDFPPDASGQIPAPSRTRHPRPKHLDEDLGEELDLTDLLSDSMIAKIDATPAPPKAPMTPFDLGKTPGPGHGAEQAGTPCPGSRGQRKTDPQRVLVPARRPATAAAGRSGAAHRRPQPQIRRLADADAALRPQDSAGADVAVRPGVDPTNPSPNGRSA